MDKPRRKYHRCFECNGVLHKTADPYDGCNFYTCRGCGFRWSLEAAGGKTIYRFVDAAERRIERWNGMDLWKLMHGE